MGTKKITQREMILQHLQRFGGITEREASNYYGCDRLSARIWELIHEDGYDIVGEYERVSTRHGKATVKRYRLNE